MSNRQVWDNHYGRDRARQQYPDENVVRVLKKYYAGPAEKRRALDLGTGSGRHLPVVAEHFSSLFAADFSEASLQLLPKGASAKAQLALPEIPFAAATFDFVLCWGVLHYLVTETVPDAISEILRVLKPGGRVFLTLRSDADTHLQRQLQTGDLASGHAQLYSKPAALQLFAGFTETQYGYIARQPLGEEGLVAHHMVLAQK
jgi:SAM-dependent methyltransferase